MDKEELIKTKACLDCGLEKPFDDFSKDKSRTDGKMIYCKLCMMEKRDKNISKKYCKIKITYPVYFKTCTRCKKILHVDNFYSDKSLQSGYLSYCKKCDTEMCKDWIKKNTERFKENQRIYRNRYKDQKVGQNRLFYELEKENILQKAKERTNNLHDTYIKSTLQQSVNIQYKDIPQDIVNLKRTTLLIKREIKARKAVL